MMKNLLSIAFLTIISISLFSQNELTPPTLVSPENEATNQMPDAELDWYAVNGIGQVSYIVEIDSSDQFDPGSGAYSTYTVTVTKKNAEDLFFGVDYFWRVKAFDETNDPSDWSEVYSFTVFDIVDLYIADDADSIAVDPDGKLTWRAKKGSTQITGINDYHVQASLDEDFSTVYFETNVLQGLYPDDTSFYYTYTENLLFDSKYFWRVRAQHDADESLWSDIWSFNTIDGPILGSPPANIEIVDEKQYDDSFQSAEVFGAYHFSKELDTPGEDVISIDFAVRAKDKLNNNIHFKALDANGNTFCIVYLASDGQIKAYDGDEPSNISAYNGGTTKNHWYKIEIDIDVNADNYDVDIIFDEDTTSTADFSFVDNTSGVPKEFIWYNDESSENIVGWFDDISIYSVIVAGGGLAIKDVYFTEDFESGNLIENDWSVIIPMDLNPNQELFWQPITGIEDYIYQVCKDPEFIFPCLTNFSDANSVVIPNLDFGETYYYRVQAYHAEDESQWSVIGKFDVINTVVLSSPANGAANISDKPTIKWEYINGAEQYEATWRNENSSYVDSEFSDTTFFVMYKTLEIGEDYYWKVRAKKNGENTEWSEEWQFHVGPEGIESSMVNGTSISFYPNPTNGQLNLEFNSIENSILHVSIVDLVGKVVLVETYNLSPGFVQEPLNIRSLNQGVYLLRFQSGEDFYSEKLIVK